MKRLSSTLPNMVLSLGLITIGAGALLGGMYQITKEPIEKQAQEQQIAAIREVAPPFDNDPEADADTVTLGGIPYIVYPAMMDGKLQGAAVKASTMEGFSGEIVLMVGFDSNGAVTDYRVLKHAETPGLGAKMEAWFRDPAGARSILGKSPASVNFTVSKDGGDVDAITAATISSRAFLGAVSRAYDAYAQKCLESVPNQSPSHDSMSGASKKADKK